MADLGVRSPSSWPAQEMQSGVERPTAETYFEAEYQAEDCLLPELEDTIQVLLVETQVMMKQVGRMSGLVSH